MYSGTLISKLVIAAGKHLRDVFSNDVLENQATRKIEQELIHGNYEPIHNPCHTTNIYLHNGTHPNTVIYILQHNHNQPNFTHV